jgi:hypothetical protein
MESREKHGPDAARHVYSAAVFRNVARSVMELPEFSHQSRRQAFLTATLSDVKCTL